MAIHVFVILKRQMQNHLLAFNQLSVVTLIWFWLDYDCAALGFQFILAIHGKVSN